MECPFCKYKDSKVIDSRHTDINSIRRRRECENCKKRFTTYERIEQTPIMVIKKDKRREEFNRDKIKSGIIRSCEKRPISVQQIDNVVNKIESDIRRDYTDEVDSSIVGNIVMENLKELDEVAYVRFASVYREFKDIETFMKELNLMQTERTKGELSQGKEENKK